MPERWEEAQTAAALLAVDPTLGGAVITARAGPAREAWLEHFRTCLNEDVPVRRIPANINDEALLGGIDLAVTLKTGRAVRRAGLLDSIQSGAGILAMAERADAGLAARLAMALDSADAPLLIALDESAEPDESVPAALAERLAFHLHLSEITLADLKHRLPDLDRESIAMARMHLPYVLNDGAERAMTLAAEALGVDSLRAPILALRAARAAAALDGQDEIGESHAALAAKLVLAPRATRLPAPEEPQEPESAQPEQNSAEEDPLDNDPADTPVPDELTEITLDAAKAAIPPGLLLQLKAGLGASKPKGAGQAGALQKDGKRGRPTGSRRGEPSDGHRLDVLATLRASAPWCRVRRKGLKRFMPGPAVEVRREDFRIKRFKQKSETATIFVVDASGSLALHRLAEAKGAIEQMLADSYVRRDQVALIAFRGQKAETLLPPTRSLTRAKRSLAALPGGGGTPLSAAIDAAEQAAHAEARRGRSVTLVFLTDGAANIARDGTAGREAAQAEAQEAARHLRAAGHSALVVDVSKRGADTAQSLAQAMGARYVCLPVANSEALADLAREVAV